MRTMQTELAVVVGTRNRIDHLKKCLESIINETSTPFKVYVLDAGSTDGTIDYLKGVASDCIIPVFQGDQLGQAAAYNAVFMTVDSEYTAWISDDNIIVNRSLDLAVDILRRNKRIGLVGLKVRDLLGPFVEAPYVGGISSVGILNINQGVLPTSILQAIGGFSEEFVDYGIDPDLTAKVLLSGHDVVMTKAIGIYHYRQWTTDAASPEFIRRKEKQARALAIYDDKYKSLDNASSSGALKHIFWLAIRRNLKRTISIDSARPIFGLLPRDWSNLLGGKFISMFDPLYHWNSNYHFCQRLPRQYRNQKNLKLEAALASRPAKR